MSKQSTANFSREELMCRCETCQSNNANHYMESGALDSLQRIREAFGKPIVLNSAYRCKLHPEESGKDKPGTHHQGIAVDVRVPIGRDRMKLIALFLGEGWTSIGWGKGFIHFDRRSVPTCWEY